MSHFKYCLFIYRFFASLVAKLRNTLFGNKKSRILHASKHFVILDKTYDLKINSNKQNEATVQTFMKRYLPSLASERLSHEYYFVHRLDYSTSGLMCIPVHKGACQVAAKAIERRLCKKYYIALVRGYPSRDLFDLTFSIGRDFRVTEIVKMCMSNQSDARTARTLAVVLERGVFDNYPTTKVLIRPITGRRHQIRIHCSHIGHTIVGDYTYSNKKDVNPSRMFLHSLRLVIPNEIEPIDVATDDPFTEKQVPPWFSIHKVYNLNQAFEKIDNLVK